MCVCDDFMGARQNRQKLFAELIRNENIRRYKQLCPCVIAKWHEGQQFPLIKFPQAGMGTVDQQRTF